MHQFVKPAIFTASTVALLAGAAMSIDVPQLPNPPVAGIDIAVSAVAASPGGTRDVFVGTTTSSAPGLPANTVAISIGTTSCNPQPSQAAPYGLADWYEAWHPSGRGEKHPYIVSQIYRLRANGRLEQIAGSWVKHGWEAASSPQGAVAGPNGQAACGNGTCPSTSARSTQLGSNCADTYGSGLNRDRFWLGPRTEVLARGTADAPGWTQRGSWFDRMVASGANDVAAATANQTDNIRSYSPSTSAAQSNKLNEIPVAEINASVLGTTGRIFMESYYVVNGDANKLNNLAHRRFRYTQPTALPSAANFTFDGPHTYGPVILSMRDLTDLTKTGWGDMQVAAEPQTEGIVYVATRVVQTAPGQWRYEYNAFNLDLDRQVSQFSVPLPPNASISDIGFNQPRVFNPGMDAGNWTAQVDGGNVTWSAPAPGAGLLANGLRWGTMFTFWFTSSNPPRDNGEVSLTQLNPGTVAGALTAGSRVPRSVADIVEVGGVLGGDGLITGDDFIAFINAFAEGGSLADICEVGGIPGPDGLVTGDDFVLFINAFANGG
jgi:hypothetical protein